jgi:hypothetical protein
MAKRRKTRKEKVRGDTRRVVPTPSSDFASPSSPLFTIPSSSPTPSKPQNTVTTHSYSYLSKDLRKTLILTSSIIIVELVLAFIVKL